MTTAKTAPKQTPKLDIPALLDLVSQNGWKNFSCLIDLPIAANTLPLHTCAWLTARMNAACPPDQLAALSPKDRLFDLLLARLEAMEPHKTAFHLLAESVRRTPALAYPFYKAQIEAMRGLLTRAGMPQTTRNSYLLLGVYHYVLLDWTPTATSSHDKTMAKLDQVLTKTFRLFETELSPPV